MLISRLHHRKQRHTPEVAQCLPSCVGLQLGPAAGCADDDDGSGSTCRTPNPSCLCACVPILQEQLLVPEAHLGPHGMLTPCIGGFAQAERSIDIGSSLRQCVSCHRQCREQSRGMSLSSAALAHCLFAAHELSQPIVITVSSLWACTSLGFGTRAYIYLSKCATGFGKMRSADMINGTYS
jgi:hypothetical protein